MATDKLVDFDHVTDYISREAALDFHIPTYDLNISTQDERLLGDRFEEFLKSIPAADVVKVVSCKDCKYWCSTLTYIDLLEARHDPYTDGVCDLYDCDGFQPNDFCSKAVRRDNYGADMREPNLDTTKGDSHD